MNATATDKKVLTTEEVAARFNELAQQAKWFEIQEELFSDDVKSIEPVDAPHLPKMVEGKANVRKKGKDWVSRIEGFHGASTTEPVVGGNYFAVGRKAEITMKDLGRLKINQLMMYEVKDGQIIREQFFY
jgi:ketosteroid isomerase-like protein